jgi:L-ascorbate metabolism protein UlaG (beta-lactamase superfamily)
VKIIVPGPELERVAMYLTKLPLNASQHVPVYEGEPINVSGVQVRAFPGPHSILNYAYLVELPDGLRLLHMGDTEHFSVLTWNADNTRIENSSDLTWVDDLANEEQIDIVFIHISALTNIPQEAIKIPVVVNRNNKIPLGRPFSETALKPKIIVPMHENEVGHGLAWFSSFNLHLAYQQSSELNSANTQVVVLAWGQKMAIKG